jgi:7,8-dihydro-6-hydroxymethylpterin-pyrophosphokinase
MYVRLAEATSKLTTENQLLTELARIVENPDIGIDRFEDIMDAALKAKTQEEKDKVLERIHSIKAEFKTQSSEKPIQRDKKLMN